MDSIAQLFDLQGKGAIVTGGGAGIGEAIASRLAEAGASVMIADIDEISANRTAASIAETGMVSSAICADARSAKDARKVVEATLQQFGSVDILVNNAGIYPMCPVMEITEELWDGVMGLNLKGAFVYSQAIAAEMIKSGRGGKIINMASIDAFKPNGSVAHYNASKGGLVMLTKALALELAPHGIRVNAVAPGAVLTPGTQALRDGITQALGIGEDVILDGYLSRVPLGRMGEPDDIAKVVLFLVSRAADYITGETIIVDGGFLLS